METFDQTTDHVVEKAAEFTNIAVAAGQSIKGRVEDTFNQGVNAVQYVVQEGGKAVAVVGERVINASKDAAKAFAAHVGEFTLGPIKKLWDLLEKVKQFGGDAGRIIDAVVENRKQFITHLLEGAKQGFEDFFDFKPLAKFQSRVEGILAEWLFGNSKLPDIKLPNPFKLADVPKLAPISSRCLVS